MKCKYCSRDSEGRYCSPRCDALHRLHRKRARQTFWRVGLPVGILVAIIVVVTFSHRARAHDPDTHQPDDLSKAYSDAYGRCCDGDDYTKLRIEEWEPTENGWRIKWHGQWLDVARNAKVKNVPNPDGEAKAWVYVMEGNAPYVRCFMPGSLSLDLKPSTTSFV